ncbi:MAG: LIC_13387 family protein [Massilia sp.]
MFSLSAILIAASAGLIFFLGSMHLLLTYRGSAFHPRDAGLVAMLQADSPRISRETSMWRAALGFHASHSLGAILFGLIYGYLALEGTGLLFHSTFLLALGLCGLSAYLLLAHRYWFKAPQRGIALAWGLYGAGLLALLR